MSDVTKAGPNVLDIVKKTSIGTLAVGAIVLQVLVFRAVGDIASSAVIFGLGYLAAKLK